MVLSNEKVSNCIPDDLVFSIFLNLPLKSLNRFQCVRKSWSLLFKNSYFMDMYRKVFISKNSYGDDTCLLLKQTLLDFENRSLLYLFSGERFENKVKIDWPPPLQEDDFDINILGSGINGVLCLYVKRFSSKIVLWNPTIQEFKVIPSNYVPPYIKVVDQLHGFGYDYVRGDYNVIRFVEFSINRKYYLNPQLNKALSKVVYDPIWEIYSLKRDYWEKLDLDMKTFYRSPPGVLEQVYVNGVCHWLGASETDINNLYLVSFDLGNKVFSLTLIPSMMDDDIIDFQLVDPHLLLLNESIALIYNDAWVSTFYISILGEIGVKESWNKLFIIGPLPYLGRPVGVWKNCDILLALEDGELARCDLSTHTIQELGIDKMFFYCQIIMYKKSLLSMEEEIID